MNKLQILINVILVTSVVTLFGITLSKKTPSQSCENATSVQHNKLALVDSFGIMPVAYLNVDSLLANYTFAQEANEKLMRKQEDARSKMNIKLRSFQNEMADFQRKWETNAFLSRERAEQEQQRLLQKEQELQQLEATLTQEIMLENQKINLQLADSLDNFLKEFNADGRYHVILSNTAKDNVLMANEEYDITNEVISGLNARYKKK